MKTIRNQLKNPFSLQLPMLLQNEIKNCRYSSFYAAKKENIDNKQKIK